MREDKSTKPSPGSESIASLTPAPAGPGTAVSEQEFSRISGETGKLLALQPKRHVRIYQAPKGTQQLPDVTVCVNGYIYLIKRGIEVPVPETVYHILEEANLI